jgi:hypothetical protein
MGSDGHGYPVSSTMSIGAGASAPPLHQDARFNALPHHAISNTSERGHSSLTRERVADLTAGLGGTLRRVFGILRESEHEEVQEVYNTIKHLARNFMDNILKGNLYAVEQVCEALSWMIHESDRFPG